MRKILLAASAALTLPLSTTADVGAGVGVSYVFGQGPAVGLKIVSDDEETETVGTFGIDYLITSGSWRPNIGVGYVGKNNYGDINVGFNLSTGQFDFGAGGGYADTEENDKPFYLPKQASPSQPPSNPCPDPQLC